MKLRTLILGTTAALGIGALAYNALPVRDGNPGDELEILALYCSTMAEPATKEGNCSVNAWEITYYPGNSPSRRSLTGELNIGAGATAGARAIRFTEVGFNGYATETDKTGDVHQGEPKYTYETYQEGIFAPTPDGPRAIQGNPSPEPNLFPPTDRSQLQSEADRYNGILEQRLREEILPSCLQR